MKFRFFQSKRNKIIASVLAGVILVSSIATVIGTTLAAGSGEAYKEVFEKPSIYKEFTSIKMGADTIVPLNAQGIGNTVYEWVNTNNSVATVNSNPKEIGMYNLLNPGNEKALPTSLIITPVMAGPTTIVFTTMAYEMDNLNYIVEDDSKITEYTQHDGGVVWIKTQIGERTAQMNITTLPTAVADSLEWKLIGPGADENPAPITISGKTVTANVNDGAYTLQANVTDKWGQKHHILYTILLGKSGEYQGNGKDISALLREYGTALGNQMNSEEFINYHVLPIDGYNVSLDDLIDAARDIIDAYPDVEQSEIDEAYRRLKLGNDQLIPWDGTYPHQPWPFEYDYTTVSWQGSGIADLIAWWENIYDTDPNLLGNYQGELETKRDEFFTAYASLVLRGENSDLINLYNEKKAEYNEIIADGKQSDYTAKSIADFEKAIADIPLDSLIEADFNAEPPIWLPDYSQQQIDDFIETLKNALVTKKHLVDKLEEVYTEINTGKYTEGDLVEINIAITEAEYILDRALDPTKHVTQQEIDDATEKLRLCLENLKSSYGFSIYDKTYYPTGKLYRDNSIIFLDSTDDSGTGYVYGRYYISSNDGKPDSGSWISYNSYGIYDEILPINAAPVTDAKEIELKVPANSVGYIYLTVTVATITKVVTIKVDKAVRNVVDKGPSVNYRDSGLYDLSPKQIKDTKHPEFEYSISITQETEGWYYIQAKGGDGGRDDATVDLENNPILKAIFEWFGLKTLTGVNGPGKGGVTYSMVYLKEGDTLYYIVGSAGEAGSFTHADDKSRGGYSGGSGANGGNGNYVGGGGGGATKVWVNSETYPTSASKSKLITVAGGGGGASNNASGGNAGGYKGMYPRSQTGEASIVEGYDGQSKGILYMDIYGKGGGTTTGGAGGYRSTALDRKGDNGGWGYGGKANNKNNVGGGGGGGAGYYGGGGGAHNDGDSGFCAAGGGGSSYIAGAMNGKNVWELTTAMKNNFVYDNFPSGVPALNTNSADGRLLISFLGKTEPEKYVYK